MVTLIANKTLSRTLCTIPAHLNLKPRQKPDPDLALAPDWQMPL